MTKRLKVCITGTGYFSQFHYDAWSRMDDADLVGLFDRTPDRAGDAARRYGVPRHYGDVGEMLDAEQPDLLDIVTPPVTHRPFIDAAIGRGVKVICQKPFCGTLAAAEAAVAAIEAAGATVIVHENFRFQPWYRRIGEALDDGLLGELYQATFRLRPGDGQGPEAYLDRQPYFQKMERFLVHETAIHLIDVFRALFGEASSVFAKLSRLNPAIAGEDAGFILFEFENGVRALFDGNRLSDHQADDRRLTMGEFCLEGSKGVLRLDGFARLWFRANGSNDEAEIAYSWEDRGYGGDCVYRTQRHIVDHLLHGSPVRNTAAEYLANLRIEEAVYASSRDGRVMPL